MLVFYSLRKYYFSEMHLILFLILQISTEVKYIRRPLFFNYKSKEIYDCMFVCIRADPHNPLGLFIVFYISIPKCVRAAISLIK